MRIGIPKETYPGERRVALIPAHVTALTAKKWTVRFERDAGRAAGFPDKDYEEKGAVPADSRAALLAESDVVLTVRELEPRPAAPASPPGKADEPARDGVNGDTTGHVQETERPDLDAFRREQIVLGFVDPLADPEGVARLAERGLEVFSMELMPRITRAQSMDALSSMATLSGYKAVLLAAGALPRLFPLMMTAAGTVSAAKVLVVGAGVAGLQAIATARRLGAVVQAYDVRPAVKEQVQSLGAKFVELELETEAAEDRGGYAKDQDEAFYRRQRELMGRVLAENDVAITTAVVPGKKAPVLVTREMVEAMRPGSVLVDLAAERGGNCELTRPGETVEHAGVSILGPLNLPATVANHASQLYSKNISNFLLHLAGKDGDDGLGRDLADEITRETLLTRDGEVVHPRVRELLDLPPIQYSETGD